jgi:hypothetical protein
MSHILTDICVHDTAVINGICAHDTAVINGICYYSSLYFLTEMRYKLHITRSKSKKFKIIMNESPK